MCGMPHPALRMRRSCSPGSPAGPSRGINGAQTDAGSCFSKTLTATRITISTRWTSHQERCATLRPCRKSQLKSILSRRICRANFLRVLTIATRNGTISGKLISRLASARSYTKIRNGSARSRSTGRASSGSQAAPILRRAAKTYSASGECLSNRGDPSRSRIR